MTDRSKDRRDDRRDRPQGSRDRSGSRDRNSGSSRGTVRPDEPALPDDVVASDLDPEVRRDLLTLDKANADQVARHLIMVMNLMSEDPVAALAHARAARERAGRIGVVRETAGIAAYSAGEWQEALGELRTARRLTGSNALLPLIADSERGLGRPQRAIDLARSEDGRALKGDEATELLIVESGARLDLNEPDKAVVTLQAADLNPANTGDTAARLFYAYATALLAAGRRDDAADWFMNAAAADVDDITDAELRLVELAEDGNPAAPVPDVTPEAASEPEPASEPEAVAEPEAAERRPEPEPESAPEPQPEPKAVTAAIVADAPTRTLATEYDALLLDLDGTVFAGAKALPGAHEALADLVNLPYYVTNNASRSAAEVADHLGELGFSATADQVVTSAQTGARLLADRLEPGTRALVVGTDSLAQEVRAVGIGVTRSADDRPDAVIQGHSPTTDWAALSEAVLAINSGAIWVACNIDPTLPSERGFLIGNGSMVAAVANATRQQPLVAGKPAAPLLTDAIERASSRKPLVVGDRLDTDIAGAVTVGADSALVLTGVTDAVALLTADVTERPTFVMSDLRGLSSPLGALRVGSQPGWSVDVQETADGIVVDVSATAAADDISALPALASAVWDALDARAGDADPLTLAINGADERVRALLDGLGVR